MLDAPTYWERKAPLLPHHPNQFGAGSKQRGAAVGVGRTRGAVLISSPRQSI